MKRTLITASLMSLTILFTAGFLYGQKPAKEIRIGVASMITPVNAVKYYQEIVDYVSEKLGQPTRMVHRRTYDEMDRMLEDGEVDAAFICSGPYIKNRRKFGVELLVAPQVNGGVFYNSYIIVHKDSNIKSFGELQGKSFAFTDPKSNSGKLYPMYRLAKKDYQPEKFFKKYVYSYSHNKSIELVDKKIVDGAAVDSLVYKYMQKKGSPYVQRTRIIEKSPGFGIPPVVVSTGVSEFIKGKIKEVLLNMHSDPEGKRILDAMLIEKFVEVPDSNYDSIRKMEAFVSKFDSPKVVNNKKDVNTVYFGIIPRDNPRIAYEKYQPIMDYLTEYTPYKFELVLKKTYKDTVNALGHGDIDIAILGPLTYLKAHAEFGVLCILKSVTEKGETFYRSVIVTRENHPVTKVSELKGKKVAFASLKSTSGNLVPRHLLAESGIHLNELSRYKNFDYHDSVIKRVLNGEYDAGAVRDTVAEKYFPQGIRVIKSSEPIPTGPVVIGPKTTYAVAETVKLALMSMPNTLEKKILEKIDPELRGGFVDAKDSDYEGIRRMINEVPKTCGIGCHPKIKL